MISPKLSKNENERVAALDSYSIFHSPPEKEYDDITKLASYVCETPMSHISFINSDVQWEKSYLGIEGGETRREITFCGHTILDKKKPLIISDARIDIRFHDNPFVKDEPHIVFYAGFPLVNPEGHVLGTLCVLDNEPRELNENQIEALEVLSNQVLKLLELRRNNIVLNATIQSLNLQNKRLNKFVKVAAHDIKSPVANLDMLIDVLIDEQWHNLNDDVKNVAKYMQETVTYIIELIDGILKNTKYLDRSHLEKEEIKVKKTIHNLISILDSFGEVNFEIQVPDDLTLTTNKTAFHQIILNLITNSLKYNDKNKIDITIRVTEGVDYVEIQIKDNGMGIKEEELNKIFDLFATTSNTDKNGFKGTGIGLTIVKSLVENLGGTISVTSKHKEGTHFKITIKK